MAPELLADPFSEEPTAAADLKIRVSDYSPLGRVAEFFGRYDFPDSIAQAVDARTIDYFCLGLPRTDKLYRQQAQGHRLALLHSFDQLWDDAMEKDYFLGIGKSHRRTGQPGINMQRMLEDRVDGGLFTCEGVNQCLIPLQLAYAEESPPVWEGNDAALAVKTVTRHGADVKMLFGGPVPEGLTLEELAVWLRATVEPDLSPETLDARFNTFMGLVNLDLSVAILRLLSLFSVTGANKERQAVAFARQHQALLLSDDFRQKRQTLLAVGGMCDAALVQTDTKERRGLGMIRAYIRNLDVNIDEFMLFFHNVYTALDCEIPLLLVESEPPSERETAPELPAPVVAGVGEVAVAQAITPESSKSEPPMRVAAELAACRQALEEEGKALLCNWRLSKRASKQLGLDPLIDKLRSGAQEIPAVEGMGEWTLAPMTNEYAVMLLGTLVRLEGIVRKAGPTSALQDLQHVMRERQAVVYAMETLRTDAVAEGYQRITVIDPPDISVYLQRVADNWHIFSQLLTEAGIETVHPGFVGNIWQVLPHPTPGSAYSRLHDEYEHRYDLIAR